MRAEATNLNGKNYSGVKARDLYFREFDAAMKFANRQENSPQFQNHLSLLERYGNEAGLPASEIAYRKQTLLYNLTQGVRNS